MFLYKSLKNKLRNNNNDIDNNDMFNVDIEANLRQEFTSSLTPGAKLEDFLLPGGIGGSIKEGRELVIKINSSDASNKTETKTNEMNPRLSEKYSQIKDDSNQYELFGETKKKIYAVDDIDIMKVKRIFENKSNQKQAGHCDSDPENSTETENEVEEEVKRRGENKPLMGTPTAQNNDIGNDHVTSIWANLTPVQKKEQLSVYTTDLQDCIPSSLEKKKRVSFGEKSTIFSNKKKSPSLDAKDIELKKEVALKERQIKELRDQSEEVIKRNAELSEMLEKEKEKRGLMIKNFNKSSKIPIRKSIDSPSSIVKRSSHSPTVNVPSPFVPDALLSPIASGTTLSTPTSSSTYKFERILPKEDESLLSSASILRSDSSDFDLDSSSDDDSSIEESLLKKHFDLLDEQIGLFKRNVVCDDILNKYETELDGLKEENKEYENMKKELLKRQEKRFAEMEKKKGKEQKKKNDKKVSAVVRRYNQSAKSLREKLNKRREMNKDKEGKIEEKSNYQNEAKESKEQDNEGNPQDQNKKKSVEGRNEEENPNDQKKEENIAEIEKKNEAQERKETTELHIQVKRKGYILNKRLVDFKSKMQQDVFKNIKPEKSDLPERIKQRRLEIEANLKSSPTEVIESATKKTESYINTKFKEWNPSLYSPNINSNAKTVPPSSPADTLSSSSSFSSLVSGGDFGFGSPNSIVDDDFEELIQAFELEGMIKEFNNLNLDEDQKNTLWTYCLGEIRELLKQQSEMINCNTENDKHIELKDSTVKVIKEKIDSIDKEIRMKEMNIKEGKRNLKEEDNMEKENNLTVENKKSTPDGKVEERKEALEAVVDTKRNTVEVNDGLSYKGKGLLRFFIPEKYLKETDVPIVSTKRQINEEPLSPIDENQTKKRRRRRRRKRQKEAKGKKEVQFLTKIDEWEQFVAKYEEFPTPTKNLKCETITEEEVEINLQENNGYESEDESEPELRKILEELNEIKFPKPLIKNQWLWEESSSSTPSNPISERHYKMLQEHVKDCFYRYDTNCNTHLLNMHSLEDTLFNEKDSCREEKCAVDTTRSVDEKGEFITPPDYPAKHNKQYELTDDVILLQDMINNAFGEEYESMIRPQINNELSFD